MSCMEKQKLIFGMFWQGVQIELRKWFSIHSLLEDYGNECKFHMQSHYACLRELALACGRQIAVVTGDEFHGKTLFHLFLCLTTLLAIKCKTLTKVNINVHDKINDWKYTFQSFTMSCSGKRCHMTSILNFQLTLHFYKYQELFISILSCIADEVEWSSPNGVYTESWWPILTSLKEKL